MNKNKILIAIILVLAFILGLQITLKTIEKNKIKNAKIIVTLKEPLETEFLSEVKVSDFIESINGTILNDYQINTKELGTKEVKFEYRNDDNIKVEYSYNLEIKDTVEPVIWLGNSYTVTKGSNINLLDKILCGDNYDANPTCEIIGEYNVNKVGSYPLTFKATDNSNNVAVQEFTLNVREPSSSSSSNYTQTRTEFSDVIANYKKDNTEIGLDLSEWQGDVDFDKLKEAGVEFVILRVGSTKGMKGDYFVDGMFEENIKKANAAGMPVGIYFYSYANSKEKAIKDANWVLEQIKPYQVDLPIAFDWENWSFYNEFHLSFFGLTDMANSFLDVFKNAGYEGMLYGSKNYLEQIYLKTDYPIWLAHYVTNTSYTGNYKYWQICSNGRVSGVNGEVDINIRYK